MPTTNNMEFNSDIYKAIITWDIVVDNGYYYHHMTKQHISCPTGTVVQQEECIGPYTSTAPIKSYVTRNRRWRKTIAVKKVFKVRLWEEVQI